MKKLLLLGFIFLIGCSALNPVPYKCTQVLVIIYNEKGVFEEANCYVGELKKSPIPIYKGTVHNLELIGRAPMISLYKKFVDLDWGFYQVWYGSQLIIGEGYGNTIYCRNINFLPLSTKERGVK